MPELPEVETVARQLAPRLMGRTGRSLRIFDPLLRTKTAPRLKGRKVVDVRRSGKQVLFEFAPPSRNAGPVWLAVHLRMTGRLIWAPNAAAEAKENRLRARIGLDRGALLFADTRRFGTFRWFKDERETRPLGVDPLSEALTVERLGEMAGKARQNMKAFLLRQDRIVGIGNIYASEILHDARISPRRHAAALRPTEVARLHGSTQKILRRAMRSLREENSPHRPAAAQHLLLRGLSAVRGSVPAEHPRENVDAGRNDRGLGAGEANPHVRGVRAEARTRGEK